MANMGSCDTDEFEVTEVVAWGGAIVRTTERCLHSRTAPVTSVVTDDTVALLCLVCDAQLDVRGY